VDWSGSADSVICRDNIDVIYDTFFLALSDYTLDSRGDVGRWYVSFRCSISVWLSLMSKSLNNVINSVNSFH